MTRLPPAVDPLLKAPPRALLSAIDRLLAAPHEHGFFQAMRLLERWLLGETAPPQSTAAGIPPQPPPSMRPPSMPSLNPPQQPQR